MFSMLPALILFSLAPSAPIQYLTSGVAAGDSLGMNVVFSATGGTVTTRGLYTAGSTGGTFQVIARSGNLADTSTVTVTRSSNDAPAAKMGIPFGPYDAWNDATLKANTDLFTATIGSTNPKNVLKRIEVARARHMKLILTLTGGAHANYLTNGVFDLAKWQARMDAYNTPAIKEAIAAGVADRTIIGNSVMDEPHVSGGGVDGNTWGPSGTMTKARVDSLCGYVKSIFPTLPAGVVHRHDIFEPDSSYRVCDFIVSQYASRLGSVVTFREGGLAMAERNGIAIAFSINIINGGTEDRDGIWDCAGPGSNGVGQKKPRCRMTAEQVRDWGQILGSAGCAMMMWRYDEAFMSQPENQQAFKDVADRLATLPAKSCTRS
jgi:hypothetical protein